MPMRAGRAAWMLALPLALAAPAAWSASVLCRAENGGERLQLRVPPSADPFEFHSIEFDRRFRVSAQYLADANKLKTYVYDFRGETAVLIHMAEYPLAGRVCPAAAVGLGLHRVYSRNYEREISLQCFAACD